MTYDNAKWHAEGFFPSDLSADAAATHIGMYFAWACLNGFASTTFIEAFSGDLDALKSREITPGAFVLATLAETMSEHDLSPKIKPFTDVYYDGQKPFLGDYCETLCGEGESAYHVADTWETYDKLQPVLDARFEAWRKTIN
ncbi:MAG: hypothetical protein AAFV45_13550 [Pseudomonadota bacterium]